MISVFFGFVLMYGLFFVLYEFLFYVCFGFCFFSWMILERGL